MKYIFNKYLFIALLFAFGFSIIGYSATYSYFSDPAVSNNNTFSAASVFPTIPPSITPTPPIAQTLVINEILPMSSCNSGQTNGQFLELWNGSGATVDLQNFKLSDGTNNIAIANSNTSLANGAYAILAKSNGVINSCIDGGDVNGAVIVNLGGTINLNVGTIRLLASDDTVIDSLQWGTGQSLQPAVNQSIERVPTGKDSATGTGFSSADLIIKEKYTPGYGTTLLINEFVANTGVIFTNEWVEIHNPSGFTVNLTGWILRDAAATTKSLSIIGTIGALNRVVFDDVGDGWLNNSGGETVQLIDNNNNIIDQHTYTSLNDDISRGRQNDASTTWKNCTSPTKNNTNNGSC